MLHTQDENGQTLLYRAVLDGNLELVVDYVQRGALLDIFDFYGRAPIEYAIDYEIKEYLLNEGASLLQPTQLHDAVLEGNPGKIKELLEKNPNFINALDDRGQTALHCAVQDARLDIVEILVKKGGRLNILDRAGYPSLYYAYDPKIKALLKQYGAEFHESEIPIDLSYTELHLAVGNGDLEEIKQILEKNRDILNTSNRSGLTPLQLALVLNNFSAANLLVNKGAEVNFIDRAMQTPLHLAVLSGQYGLVKNLVEHGATIDAADRYGNTPLHLAAETKNFEIANFLLKNNANPELNDYFQVNVIEKSKEENTESGTKKHTSLSKMFKRRIELDKKYLEKMSLAFEHLFKEQIAAISPDKKILVLCGEIHGNYKVHQLEKSLLKGMAAAGLSCLCIESPQESGYVTANVAKIAKDKYDMLVQPVDIHPERETASVLERNVYIKDKIVDQNQHAVFITGGEHLQSLLEEGEAQIPTSLFHVIPINLASIIQNNVYESPEIIFASDPAKVIQVLLNNEKCFTEIDLVIDCWNRRGGGLEEEPCQQEERNRRNQYIASVKNKISGTLDTLRGRIQTMEHPLEEAITVANNLLSHLEREQDAYIRSLRQALYNVELNIIMDFHNDQSIKEVNQEYIDACDSLINDKNTRAVLERDLGWGPFLNNLLKTIVNIVIKAVSFGTVNNFFAMEKSETIETIDASRNSLKS